MQALGSLLLLLGMLACQVKQDEPVYQDHLGETFCFSQQHHRSWVLLHYWASWCHACQHMVPTLNQWSQQTQQPLVIRGVNVFETEAVDLTQLSRTFDMHYPTLTTDPRSYLGIAPIKTVPALVLIDRKGQVHSVAYGPKALDVVHAVLNLNAP